MLSDIERLTPQDWQSMTKANLAALRFQGEVEIDRKLERYPNDEYKRLTCRKRDIVTLEVLGYRIITWTYWPNGNVAVILIRWLDGEQNEIRRERIEHPRE